jgi:hypothetical protein
LLVACGSDNDNTPKSTTNPDAKFVGTEKYQISADIDPETFTQVEPEYLGFDDGISPPREGSYVITAQSDLDLFNQELPVDQQVVLTDLDLYSYFFIRAPYCSWFELSSIKPVDQSLNEFIVTFNEFNLPDVVCAAVMEKTYYVFKAEKLFSAVPLQ